MKKIISFLISFFLMLNTISANANSGYEMIDSVLPALAYNDEDVVTLIVEAEGDPVMVKKSAIDSGIAFFDEYEEKTLQQNIKREQNKIMRKIQDEVFEDAKVGFTYNSLFNGFSVEVKYGDIEKIKDIDGVKNVYVSEEIKIEPRVLNSVDMIDAIPQKVLNNTGKGQVIAIIDTEFEVEHDAFSASPISPKYDKSDIETFITSATFSVEEKFGKELISNDVYGSEKIPFRYDYGEGDKDTTNPKVAHGTHVAGIAGGKSAETGFLGVAPDAQLILMKVTDKNGALASDTIMAALDDASKLGVCAINCSYGADYSAINAFPAIKQCYDRAYAQGIFISAAAGNASRGFYGANSKTDEIDDAAAGTPNGYECTTAVASAENSAITLRVAKATLESGDEVEFIEPYPNYTFLDDIPEGGIEYIDCGYGRKTDFANVDVHGKVAVVRRGINDFSDKSNNAKAAGAVCVVVTNNSNSIFTTAEQGIPMVYVSADDGMLLFGAQNKKIVLIEKFAPKSFNLLVSSPISTYSSYGVSENLILKPEISAPGGNIYSSYPGGIYKNLSGTSMAAPHISGVVAIMNEYLDSQPNSPVGVERMFYIQNLLMSTANVLYKNGINIPFSPRVQGAGMVDVDSAMKTPVILLGDTETLPLGDFAKTKLSLGDGIDETIDISFVAKNLTDERVIYDEVYVEVVTDGYRTEGGKNYISDTVQLDVVSDTIDDSITIDANSAKTVSGTITLDKNQLLANSKIFTEGFFIDGFVHFRSKDGLPSLSIPFMGFYDNWTDSNIFDTTMYDEGGSSLVNLEKGIYGTYLYTNYSAGDVALGYDDIANTYNKDCIAISPDNNGYGDSLTIMLTPKRSINSFKVQVINEFGVVKKAIKVGGILSKYNSYIYTVKGLDSLDEGNYTLLVTGCLNYQANNATEHSLSFPFVIDKTMPSVDNISVHEKTLTVDLEDDNGIKAVYIYNTVTGEFWSKTFPEKTVKERISYTFSNTSGVVNREDILLKIEDNAFNSSTFVTGGLGKSFNADISDITRKSSIYSIDFTLSDCEEIESATAIVAFYDSTGTLVHTNHKKNIKIKDGLLNFSGLYNIMNASKCKLFVWDDLNNFCPLEQDKVFRLDMYENSN